MQVISLFLLCCAGLAVGRYIAIPIEDSIDVNDLTRLRIPREVEAIGVIRGPRDASQSDTGGEYVDFGAHTGARGSYGWYADFPVHRQS